MNPDGVTMEEQLNELRHFKQFANTVAQNQLQNTPAEYTPLKCPAIDFTEQTKRIDQTKDSGIGVTQYASSSASGSSTTSPEQDPDLPKKIAAAPPKGTSTPFTRSTRKNGKEKHVIARKPFDLNSLLDPSTPTVEAKPSLIFLASVVEAKQKLEFNQFHEIKSSEKLDIIPEGERTIIKQKASRRKHRQMHPCDFCEKQFDRPSLLKRHTLTHTGERPFECRYCSKGFSTRSGVNTHERTHTGQRPYVCRICGRRFAAGSNLIFHKYTHTNTRRHACSQCPKAFVTPGDLRKHEYTHSGAWPFSCNVCKRGFATERNLKSHEVSHTGNKPFTCTRCSKSYAQESSLKTHIRIHQRDHTESSSTNDNTSQIHLTFAHQEANSKPRVPVHLVPTIYEASGLSNTLLKPNLIQSPMQYTQNTVQTRIYPQNIVNYVAPILQFPPQSEIQLQESTMMSSCMFIERWRMLYHAYLQDITATAQSAQISHQSAFREFVPQSNQTFIPPPPFILPEYSSTSPKQRQQQQQQQQQQNQQEEQSIVLDLSNNHWPR